MTGKLRLPSLNALRVFHAVVQHKSFRQAADELLVTPQAVGQQIKLLEDTLQVTLFERKGRSIELTESAILLSHYVKAGFDEFSEGVRRVTKSNYRDRINLNASPYFATHYLLPRLSLFREILPGADLRLTTMVDLPDFGRDDIDMTVQWGYGNWPDYETTLLVPDPKIICCTPAIGEKIKSAQDLTRFTLLDTVKSKRLWPDILRHLAVELTEGDRSIGFDDAATMRRATLQGIGIGLVSVIDAEEDLKSGALVAPLGRDALSDMKPEEVPGFYLVMPRGHLRVKAVAALHRWLVQQDWGSDLKLLPKPIPLTD
ncbi:LysR substrate-binding domain-containing protein [Mesorhizobium sp. WSM4935]|jgi:LysR family glycine cleavage system transcriptional activator|uniref:LysR substrate-binding domain-containing protein n=1 Tax=Mesorhizobium sp. WSM4935 TaxID=3038547 RepID=UPI000507D15C|nr:LysR substrate-binding domain-containing protein [Mesorhizobium sp. WSM4935]MDG4874084.1 LysR substrate-binding domain-containing protein [Mesorhizobium sp. WSM4935]CDX19462.1 LysR substrate-binding protein [Mesorhizobium sp. SOD10]